MKKLNLLKKDLIIWNREIFGRIDIRLKKVLEDVQMIDAIEGLGGLSREEFCRRSELKKEA